VSRAGARVLLAWELGGNLGHVTAMLALAKELRERGHRPVFALRDLSNALLLARERFAFFPAPGRASPARKGVYPSYAAMLAGEAFPSANGAVAAALAWRSIFRAVRPEVLVADHAPAALLAARGLGFRVATFGAPFAVPIASCPLPVFGKQDAEAEEEKLLKRLNAALTALRAPKLDAASDLYRVDATMVRALPETDCFAPRPSEDYVSAQPADAGEALPEWPAAKGAKVLVYLKSGPWLWPVSEALAARDASAVAYIPGLDDKAAAKLERPGLVVARQLCKFSELTEQSDLVLCHASHGTVAGSMLAGKPLVMMPTYVEQLLTSARVVAAGAGAVPRRPDARSIARCLDAVAPGSTAQAQARKIATKHKATNASPQAIERVEALLV
jgi:UDP:flavonoid glycosyltransferase YjiC (YdhE family)